MQAYEDLIRDWGRLSGISIVPGSRHSCSLLFPSDQMKVHLDLDKTAERLLIGCQLGVLNPGPYRDQIFYAALKANTIQTVQQGILAFSSKLGALVLFLYLPLASTDAHKLQAQMTLFRAYAHLWLQALKKEEVPLVVSESSTPQSSGMFGLAQP